MSEKSRPALANRPQQGQRRWLATHAQPPQRHYGANEKNSQMSIKTQRLSEERRETDMDTIDRTLELAAHTIDSYAPGERSGWTLDFITAMAIKDSNTAAFLTNMRDGINGLQAVTDWRGTRAD